MDGLGTFDYINETYITLRSRHQDAINFLVQGHTVLPPKVRHTAYIIGAMSVISILLYALVWSLNSRAISVLGVPANNDLTSGPLPQLDVGSQVPPRLVIVSLPALGFRN